MTDPKDWMIPAFPYKGPLTMTPAEMLKEVSLMSQQFANALRNENPHMAATRLELSNVCYLIDLLATSTLVGLDGISLLGLSEKAIGLGEAK